jgi:7-carboxy-7-deazaguanine synthase
VDDIIHEVESLGNRLVLLTGGEPLLQAELGELAQRLLDRNFEVMIETSGAHEVGVLPREVIKIVDIKTPGSGEMQRMKWTNLEQLEAKDAVKFVLVDEADYLFARTLIREQRLAERFEVLLSPAWGQLDPRDLVRWMLRDHIVARLNLQIHKYVWGADAAGV